MTDPKRFWALGFFFLVWPALSQAHEGHELEGELETIILDSPGLSAIRHFIKDAKGEKMELILSNLKQLEGLRSGSRIRVKGSHSGKTMMLGGDSSIQVVSAATPPRSTIGEQKTVTLLFNFYDNQLQPYSVDSARYQVLTVASNYYKEQSFGQTWFTGDVYGWFTVPVSASCNGVSIGSDYADQLATAAGIDLSQYTRIIYLMPYFGCWWAGMGNLGGPAPTRSWVQGNNIIGYTPVISHEVGHNYGLPHAKSKDCGSVAFSTNSANCSVNEYGDMYDNMGNGSQNSSYPTYTHSNAAFKEYLGWMSVPAVTASGVYEIVPIESLGAGNKGLKITSQSGSTNYTYYLEYRQRTAFDQIGNANVLSGLMVHLKEADGNVYALDMTPNSAPNAQDDRMDPALAVGKTYVDPGLGFTITPISTSAASILVNIQFTNTVPVVSMTSPASGAILKGTATVVSASASAAGGIAGVQFKLDGANLGAEDTAAPYSLNWAMTLASNGAHTLTAVARTAAGNTATSAPISVTVAAFSEVAATAISSNAVMINWTTNEASDSQVEFWPTYITNVPQQSALNTVLVTSHSMRLSGLTPNYEYTYRLKSRNQAGNLAVSGQFTFNMAMSGPSVALSTPAQGAFVSGAAVTVSANASDSVGVVGVQFKLDGANLGAEDTLAPYSVSWNTTLTAAGYHTLYAVARNAAGIASMSTSYGVTVDNTPPLISGVTASSISSGTAKISWTKNEDAYTQVEYGLSTAYGQISLESYPPLTSPSMGLSGLSAGTLYHYRLKARDLAGNLALSGDYTFTTLAGTADTTAPSVAMTAPSGGAIVSGSAVTVSASASDNVGVAGVQFKLDGVSLGAEDTSAPYSLSWNSTLASNAGHTLTAVARDAAGNTATSAAISVTVSNTAPDTTAPLISGVASSNITAGAATIAWTTNEAADSQVEYGLSTAYGQSSALNSTMLTSHSLGLSGLSAGTLYHYRVKSRDQAGNLAISGDFTFSTPSAADTTVPSVALTAPAGGTIVSGSAVTVSASASDNVGVAGVQFKLDGANLGAEDTSAPYSLSWNSTLAANGSHTLSAVARDAAGNTATAAAISVTVSNDTTAPLISGVASSNITAGAATINWTTNEASDSQVEYGLSTAYGQSSALNTALVTSHSLGLSGLSSGTLYHYRVRSRDQAGNLALSGDFTFSTPAAPDTTPPAAAILSPASGANVKQNVSVKVSASDNLAVSRIELWADGALAKTQTLSPAVPSATVSFAWRAATKGPHTLQAKAYDAAGNSGASALITVNVTGKMSAVSLVGAGSPALGEEPPALMISLQQANEGAALAFNEDITKAAITDLGGHAIMSQSRQGNASMVMPLRPASGGRQAMPAGVYIILMTNDAGDNLTQSIVVVK